VRLISELKRRNVFRMAVLYVVVAWLVMQVAEVVIGLANLPDWSGQVVLAVLAVGFPIALVISWFYELTPEGVALEKDVPEGTSITHATGRRMDFIVIAVLSAGLILFAGDKWWPRGPMELSIAVLPFQNMSPDPDQEYFADGLSEEIRNLLAHIRPLHVIARTSSSSFKGMNLGIPTIALQLNARYLVEGSVRADGDRVRITAQLIDSKDGMQVWSHTYDRDLSAEDLFYIQSDVARAITDKLRVTLTSADEERLARTPTDNTEAYAAYLLGRHWLADRRVEELGKAAAQFARAIELDPNFAAAYSGLADACFLYIEYSGGYVSEECPDPDPAGEMAYRAVVAPLARKAVQLDPELGEAWVSLGSALEGEADSLPDGSPRDERLAKVRKALDAYEHGLTLNPSHAQGYHWYGLAKTRLILYDDSWERWLEASEAGEWQSIIERGLEVDPLSIMLHYQMSEPMFARSNEEAFYHARRIIEIAPNATRGYTRLADLSWYLSGRIDDYIRWKSRAAEIDPLQPWYLAQVAYGYATLGDIDMALAYLERGARLFANGPTLDDWYVLKAIILLGSNEDSALQQVADVIEPVSVRSTERLEIEANLAIMRGEARDWFTSHAEYLSGCLEAEIDEAYVNNWRECGSWLDALLWATGDQERVRRTVEERMKWYRMWQEQWPDQGESHFILARYFAMLGQHDKTLDHVEKFCESYRGNPYRYFLEEDLRFLLYNDPILDPVRDKPRFQAAVKLVEADLAQQLENVREMERKGVLPTLEEVRAELSLQ
jgi:TolB-like protein